MNLKRFLLAIVSGIFTITVLAQVESGVFTCSKESFDILKQLSNSRMRNGELMLFTTTHQDIAWLDQPEACMVHRDTLWLTPYFARLKNEPDFKFDIECSYEVMEYVSRHPEMKQQIKDYLRAGRLSVGSSYVMPYEEMYFGESFARQFYFGTRYMQDEFDYTPVVYYNADVPGRTLQASQVAAKSGSKYLVATRMARHVFNWSSPDGSKLLLYTPNGTYKFFYDILAIMDTNDAIAAMGKEALAWGTELPVNDVKGAKTVAPAMLNFEFLWDQKPISNVIPFMTLWNSIEYVRSEEGKPVKVNLPKFKFVTGDEFFNTLTASSSKVPTYTGERPDVWLYIHGPSHERALTASREGDVLLPMAEKLHTFAFYAGKGFNNYPQERINAAWKDKIYPDHGWGGYMGDVTDNTFLRIFESARSESKALVESGKQVIASSVAVDKGKGTPIIVFNTLGWQRSDVVAAPVTFPEGMAGSVAVQDIQGETLASQLTETKFYNDGSLRSANLNIMTDSIPSMGYTTLYLTTLSPESHSVPKKQTLFTNKKISNRFYDIELVPGGIKSIYDKQMKKQLLDTKDFLGGEVITMRSVGNGAGEFARVQMPTMENFDRTSDKGKWSEGENGLLYETYCYRIPIYGAVIEQTLKVYKTVKKIDIDLAVRNFTGELYREFRMMMPLNMSDSQVSYEVPYGVVNVGRDELPVIPGQRYDYLSAEQTQRGIVNWISAAKEGIAVTMSSSVVVWDYVDPTDRKATNTILQPILLASRKSCHGKGNEYNQIGDHFYHFSLTSSEPDPVKVNQWGVGANEKPEVVFNPCRYEDALMPMQASFLSLDNPNVVVAAFKKCEDDNSVVIRLYNLTDIRQRVSITPYVKPKSIVKTNLIEREQGEVQTIELDAFAIETYKLKY